MKVTIRVTGLREVNDALHELPKATARNTMRRVLTQLAEPIAEDARSLAPVDKGSLSRSISVSGRLSRRARRGRQKLSPTAVEMFVGPAPMRRGGLQEFGTTHNAPHPFMRPAWDKNQSLLLPRVADMMWKEISAAVTRKANKEARAAAREAAAQALADEGGDGGGD